MVSPLRSGSDDMGPGLLDQNAASRGARVRRVMRSRSKLLCYGAEIVLLAACGAAHSQETQSQSKPTIGHPDVTYPNAPGLGDYLIGNGDVLHVSVWGQAELERTVSVQPDGKISLPLVAEVPVTGLSVQEAQDLLREKLLPFVKRPIVTVNVAEVRSKVVYVTGEVQRPGAYVLTNRTNVLQIIARAGGVTDFAKTRRVVVFHANGDRIPVNLKDFLKGRDLDKDFSLAPGDTVLIP